MPGVKKVVQVGDNAVAVVADTFWHAKTALEALPIVWDDGRERQGLERHDRRVRSRTASTPTRPIVGNKAGDAKAAIAGAAKKVEAVYSYPYQNHAAMEPMNATALYTADKCEVWCGTQNGEGGARAPRSQASGLPADKCDVYKIDARRRLRPARPRRLCHPGGADRQADAGHAGQADLVARRGHAARAATIRSRSAR